MVKGVVVDTPRPRGRHPLDPLEDTLLMQRQTQDPQADIPPQSVEMATEAGGTHPTGMHSCFKSFSLSLGVHGPLDRPPSTSSLILSVANED